jgi:hypothetical protein
MDEKAKKKERNYGMSTHRSNLTSHDIENRLK